MAKYTVILTQDMWIQVFVEVHSSTEVDMDTIGRMLCGPEWDSWDEEDQTENLGLILDNEHENWGSFSGPWKIVQVSPAGSLLNTDVNELITVLQSAHCWARDASEEMAAEAEFAAEIGRTVGRGFQFASRALPDVVDRLERLADLLADHFGVVFLQEAVDSES